MDGDAILLCLCSCPDATSAEQLAGALVGERLAACINIVPGLRSVFRWQGSVQRESEVLLLMKTTVALPGPAGAAAAAAPV